MGIEKPSCLDERGSATNRWCSYEAADPKSMVAEYCFLALLAVLGLVIFRGHRLLRRDSYRTGKQRMYSRVYLLAYRLLLGWLTCTSLLSLGSLIKTAINIFIYEIYIKPENWTGQEDQTVGPVVVFAPIFTLFDSVATFFLLFVITFIPYTWYLCAHVGSTAPCCRKTGRSPSPAPREYG